jgi:tRNA-2-methylthio-N6-dimethylallyladenosine synthase
LTEPKRKSRNQRLLDVVNRIAIAKNAALVGTVQQVLCEGPSKTNAAPLRPHPAKQDRHLRRRLPKLTGQLLDIRDRGKHRLHALRQIGHGLEKLSFGNH